MRIYSAMFAATTAPPSRPSVTAGRGGLTYAGLSSNSVSAPGAGLVCAASAGPRRRDRHDQFREGEPGQRPARTSGHFHRHDDLQSEPIELSSRIFVGASWRLSHEHHARAVLLTFKAGAPLTETYSWTVPAGTKAGTYTLYVAVYNPTYSVKYAQTNHDAYRHGRQRSGADGYGAAGGQRHGPGRRRPRVNDRNLDGRNVLCLSVGGERGEDRGGDGGDVHPCFERRRTHADIHSDGDRIFRHGGVSDQRSDGPDCGGEFAFRIQTGSNGVAFTALHTYFMSPTGSDSNNGLTAATAWATPNHAVNCGDVIIAAAGSMDLFKAPGERLAIARPLLAESMELEASTSPRCFAAAPTWARAISRQRPLRAATRRRFRFRAAIGRSRDGMSIPPGMDEHLKATRCSGVHSSHRFYQRHFGRQLAGS